MLTMMLLFAMVMMILVVTMVMMPMMVLTMMMLMLTDIISLLLSLRGHLHNRRSSLFHLDSDLDLDLVSYNL